MSFSSKYPSPLVALILIVTIACALSHVARAQIPNSLDGLDITVSSDNPVPGQTIIITARSYSFDINAAAITWVVDGKNAGQGTGNNTLQVIAPPLGKKMTIQITAVTLSGIRTTSSVTIGSGSVDMVVETDGYVPPFFMGKVQPVYQNSVKITAVPHLATPAGVEYDPKTLLYKWSKNERVIEDQSGYGKQSVTLVGDIVPRPYNLNVIVSSRDGSAQGQSIVDVTPGKPFISFYINDPLYGPLFNRVSGDTVRIGSQKETSILAVPFGFNKPIGGTGDLSLSWLINGIEHAELATNESIVIRAPADTAGSSDIQLNITNNEQILQGASAGLTTSFTSKPVNSTLTTSF